MSDSILFTNVTRFIVASAFLASAAAAQTQKAAPPSSASAMASAGETAKAISPELTGLLTKETGVTQKQAEGGAGAIFSYAKTKLKADDFAKVSKTVPDMNGLLKAAPAADTGKSSGAMGALSGAASSMGGTAGTVAALAPAFQKLGLSGDTVGKFIPVVVDYVTKKGGSSVGSLLGGVLK
jgi:hypothetical protein